MTSIVASNGSEEGDVPDAIMEEVVEEIVVKFEDSSEDDSQVTTPAKNKPSKHKLASSGGSVLKKSSIKLEVGSAKHLNEKARNEPVDLSSYGVKSDSLSNPMLSLGGDRSVCYGPSGLHVQDNGDTCVQAAFRNLDTVKTENFGPFNASDSNSNIQSQSSETSSDEFDQPPSKRAKTLPSEQSRFWANPGRLDLSTGFKLHLEAPTAQWVRKNEDRCTYLNKGQFYGLTMAYKPDAFTRSGNNNLGLVKSVVMLLFRDASYPEDELNAWEFWHQRQSNSLQRILDVEFSSSDQSGISHVEDESMNSVAVYWRPNKNPALLSLAIHCLSTDFSLQKGVKGMPMNVQVDTFVRSVDSNREYKIVHRAYCQVKVFCDKGAERKVRHEQRRASRKVAQGGQRVLDLYHKCQDRSEFYTMGNLTRVPVLFSPAASHPGDHSANGHSPGGHPRLTQSKNSVAMMSSNRSITGTSRRKMFPPIETRMVIYVRQENEEFFTPLHLVPPTVPGLAMAIEAKYNVSAEAVRFLYRRNKGGVIAKLDDDLLKFYCNEDIFLMQVTAVELEGVGVGQDNIMYDITLCELET